MPASTPTRCSPSSSVARYLPKSQSVRAMVHPPRCEGHSKLGTLAGRRVEEESSPAFSAAPSRQIECGLQTDVEPLRQHVRQLAEDLQDAVLLDGEEIIAGDERREGEARRGTVGSVRIDVE